MVFEPDQSGTAGPAEPTIFALSSGAGRSGIAVIRVSGPASGDAVTALGGKTDRPRSARLVRLVDPENGDDLDEALVIWFPGPASFTGENMAEFHVHGGRAVVAGVLDTLSRLPGLIPADPGGFTRQAFGNGRLDLTEIEGLADLIDAETTAQRRLALRQMEGRLSDRYEDWRKRLIAAMALVAADIDFTDEELPEGLVSRAMPEIDALVGEMSRHLDDGRRGERLRAGYRIVLAGPPNAGKSSLLNVLARREVAIVSTEAGTTRDILDVSLDLGGYPVEISDTAGLRQSEGAVEQEGVRRARARASDADLVLWLRDLSNQAAAPAPDDLSRAVIEVGTKLDLVGDRAPDGMIAISTHTGAGMDGLIHVLEERAAAAMEIVGDAGITRLRHRRAIEACRAKLKAAIDASDSDVELVAENLRSAAFELSRLTGRVDVEDLLDVIFRDFCIGK